MVKIVIIILLVAVLHISLAKNEGNHKVSDLKKNAQEHIKQVLATKTVAQNQPQKKVETNQHQQHKSVETNKHQQHKTVETNKHPQHKTVETNKPNSQQQKKQEIHETKLVVEPKKIIANQPIDSNLPVIKKTNVIFAPDLGNDCPAGSQKVGGVCRQKFRRRREIKPIKSNESNESDITSDDDIHAVVQCIIDCPMPTRCPPGQKEDAHGVCRDDWGK